MELVKERISSVQLDGISFRFNYSGALGADPYDELNDNECKDTIEGEIDYFNDEGYDDNECLSVGKFNCSIIYGSELSIYNTLEYGGSITDVRYQDEIFNIKHTHRGTEFTVREEYDNLFPHIYDNKFMILDRVEVNDFFRGHGIITKLIPFLNRTFSCPILIKPYPLQYEGEGMDYSKDFERDLNKVVESYQRCGFSRVYDGSEYLILW